MAIVIGVCQDVRMEAMTGDYGMLSKRSKAQCLSKMKTAIQAVSSILLSNEENIYSIEC